MKRKYDILIEAVMFSDGQQSRGFKDGKALSL